MAEDNNVTEQAKTSPSQLTKPEDFVGQQIYLKKGSFWHDDATDITLLNIPISENDKGVRRGSNPEDRIKRVPKDCDLMGVWKAYRAGIIGLYKKGMQVNTPMQRPNEGAPRQPQDNKDYYFNKDGQMVSKNTGQQAYQILQESPDRVVEMIRSISDLDLLNTLLSLEKSGQNLSYTPRPSVIDSIQQKLKDKNVSGISVSKEGPEMVLTTDKLT